MSQNKHSVKILAIVIAVFLSGGFVRAQTSTLVYEAGDGTLGYRTYANEGETNAVNTVPDFSNCGYKGGGVPIPFVPAVVTVNAPTGGDDTALIQNAINTAAGKPMQANGFRGAVLIKAGNYKVSSTLNITKSGVVIRGEGQQASGGTKITMTATVQDNLFEATGSGSPSEVGGTRVSITDSFVPSGATSFNVSNASGFAVGDNIRIHYKMNDTWISAIGMDLLTDHPLAEPDDVNWTAAGYQLYYERTITAKSGNTITINAPLVQSIETQYGGADIFKYTFSGQISNVGFEALRLESTYLNNTDELHGWVAIKLQDLRDSWVRQVTAKYFGLSAVSLSSECHHVTIEDCAMVDPKSITTGGRKYSFNISGSAFVLMQRCYTWGGRHDYVSGSRVCGPNVFVDCLAENTFSDVGPHHRYSTGQLYDNIKCGQLSVQNRTVSGTGHGWSGAQIMAWNSVAPELRCDAPVGAMNWNVGCIGAKLTANWPDPRYPSPFGIWESHGTHVTPRSLYYTQLQDRLGRDALRKVIIPEQESGNIWTQLSNWAGDGLFGNDVVAWTLSEHIMPPTNTVSLAGRIRNLQMLDHGVTSAWSKVSGPGSVTFGDATALETTAGFSTAGWYVLRLTVGDGSTLASTDVRVRYGDNAPVVDAGTNQTVVYNAPVPWTPAEMETAVWYDASDTNTITASGGAVAQWYDKSGNGNHATQATAGNRPITGNIAIGGLNAISFRVANQQYLSAADSASLNLDSSGGANVFAVFNYLGYVNSGSALNVALSKGLILDAEISFGIRLSSTNVLSYRAGLGAHAYAADWHNQNLLFSGTGNASTKTAKLYVNGTLGGFLTSSNAIPSDNTNPLYIGRDPSLSRFSDVDFGEIIVVGGALSVEEREKLEGYLAHKWGLADSLPAGHPYKNFAPTIPATMASLDGTVSDPESDPVTVTWSMESGPAAVAFSNASAVDTTVSFTTNGIYILRLTADDGFVQSYDDVVITVTSNAVTAIGSVPYAWLAAWTNEYEASVTNDWDNDGFTTAQEYWSGTDPMNSNSYLRLDAISYDGTNIVLKWRHAYVDPAIPPISIQSRTNLTDGGWFPAGQVSPVDGLNAWSNTVLSQAFYRLSATNAP